MMDFKAQVLSDGSIALLRDSGKVASMHVQEDGGAVPDIRPLAVEEDQFNGLMEQAATHDISIDMGNNKLMLTPKETAPDAETPLIDQTEIANG